jgi:hypothetical protein
MLDPGQKETIGEDSKALLLDYLASIRDADRAASPRSESGRATSAARRSPRSPPSAQALSRHSLTAGINLSIFEIFGSNGAIGFDAENTVSSALTINAVAEPSSLAGRRAKGIV